MRFLGLKLSSKISDAKTIWLFANTLAQAGLAEQRNTREENELIKQDAAPLDWQNEPAKRAQKDIDARWTQKNGEKHFGYKDHINVDKDSKLITSFTVTDAAVHDSQVLPALLHDAQSGGEAVYADSAYKSDEIDGILFAKGLNNKIHERGYRNKPLTDAQIADNTFKSRKRSRVEHVFGSIKATMRGAKLRCIGLVRAKFNIGLMNLTYNLKRVEALIRLRVFDFDRVSPPVGR